MTRCPPHPSTGAVLLRDVAEGDLPVFYEHQLDPEANRMAGFTPRDRDDFTARWKGVLADETITKKTILFDGRVAGNVVCFGEPGEREVGYWIDREYWGKGVATRALSEFLDHVKTRPLYARVARHNAASIRVLEKCGFEIAGDEVEELVLELGAKETERGDPTAERSAQMRTEDGGVFVGPDAGKVLVNPIGGRMVAKVRDEDTGGAYSIHDNTVPPGSPGPRPHLHHDHDETFYVLEGELTVRVGPREITAPAGSFVVVPRGVVHQPSNPGTEPTRVLLIFSPAGMDRFFEEAAEGRMPLQAEPTDPAVQERLAAFTRKYGYEFAELPPVT